MFMCVIVALLLADPIYSAVPKSVEVLQNESISLRCPSRGFHNTSYSWYKLIGGTAEKKAVALNDRFEQVSDKLLITKANVEDAGRYLCVSNTSVGIESSETILTIIIPLKASIEPQVQTIDVGKPAVFTCRVEGNSNLSISWWKDEVRIEHHSAVLLIPSVTIKDQGNYRCSVCNGHDTAEATAQLKLKGRYESPQILSTFGEKTLQPGSNVSLICMATGNPTPEITWDVYGKRIIDGDSVQVGQYVNGNGSVISHLNMTSLQTDDGGIYKCSATNEIGSEEYAARINVYGMPDIKPMAVSIVAGDTLIVTCPVVGYPIETITWKRNDRYLPVNRNQKVFSNGTLIIKNFGSSSTQHRYDCVVKDPNGYSVSVKLEVQVLVPPKFKIKLHEQTSHRGESAKLKCEAKGDKPIEVLWSMNGKHLDLNDNNRYTIYNELTPNGINSYLSIEYIDRGDSALFTCVAINAFGRDNTTFNMIVQDVPEVPYNVEILDKSERSIQLSWVAPFDGNTSIIQYIIKYKISEGSWLTDMEHLWVFGEHTETSINELKPGMIYHLRIVAMNEIGSSKPSDTIRFVTAEEAPSGPPTDVRIEAINSNALNVRWKPPNRADWNGKILGYNVGYKPAYSDNAYIFQTTESRRDLGNDNLLVIRDLKMYTPYSIVVQAFNKVGSGPTSEVLIQYTAEGAPDQPPRDITCMAVTSQRIRVSWVSPPLVASNGFIKGYKVIYGPSNSWDDKNEKNTIITSSKKTFLPGLHKYTNYTMQVLAYTASGDGVLSSPIQCRTEEDFPDKPENVKALAKSSNSVIISWKPPTKSNGIIEHYTTYLNEVSDNSEKTTKQSYKVQPTQMIYKVTELDKSKIYEFYVTASTYMGEGEPSNTLILSPADQIPVKTPSINKTLKVADQEDIKLPCVTLNVTQPKIHWEINGEFLSETEHVRQLPDGSLFIKEATHKDAGKYSCYVNMQFEQNFMTYKLLIPGPPNSPKVTLGATTNTSFTLNLQANFKDTEPLSGYTIHYKSLDENWMTVNLTSPVENYTLENLLCGSKYELYVKGYNSIGTGDASDKLIMKTNGSAPIGPDEYDEFITPFSDGVSLNLDSWSDGGCLISHFDIGFPTYTSSSSQYKVKAGGDFDILGLYASTRYNLYVTAYNDAGHTEAQYNFQTLRSYYDGY